MVVTVAGKRKMDVSLDVTGNFKCLSKKWRLAKVLKEELEKKKRQIQILRITYCGI